MGDLKNEWSSTNRSDTITFLPKKIFIYFIN
jgi:hypothetical protein